MSPTGPDPDPLIEWASLAPDPNPDPDRYLAGQILALAVLPLIVGFFLGMALGSCL